MFLTSAPLIQQHELTSKCNNNCPFCYNPERCIDSFTPRDDDRQRNIEVAKISVEKGVMAACPTGGEPLVMVDHLFEILDIYNEAGCYTSINSNGRLVTAEIAKRLKEKGLNSALISIHGLDDLHDEMVGIPGAFPETWQGIILLKDAGIAVTPNFVATAKNIHGLLDVGIALLAIGVRRMTVTPFLPSWGALSHEEYVLYKKHYRKYFESIRKIRNLGVSIDSTLPIPPCILIRLFPDEWKNFLDVHSPRICMAGRTFGVISPDANFRACIQAPYLENFGGNMQDDYKNSWKKANHWAHMHLIPRECPKCEALEACGGGCRTSSLWENDGSVTGCTMYMGKALTKEEALPFKQRLIHAEVSNSHEYFTWNEHISFRNEDWGIIVFNKKNQSFTLLSNEMPLNLKAGDEIKITSEKLRATLLAIQAISPVDERSNEFTLLNESIEVLPAGQLLPRLAQAKKDPHQVYCLRADTGERYFF